MKHLLTAIACFFALSMSAQTWNPDADFDNVIGVNDLMELLSVFGTEWTATYPQDPAYELAAYYSGELDLFDCINSCRVNNGKVVSFIEYGAFRDSIDVAIGHTEAVLCDPDNQVSSYTSMWCSVNSRYGYGRLTRQRVGPCDSPPAEDKTSIYEFPAFEYLHNSRHCVCAGLVPVVE